MVAYTWLLQVKQNKINIPGSFSMQCTSVPVVRAPKTYASPSFALTVKVSQKSLLIKLTAN